MKKFIISNLIAGFILSACEKDVAVQIPAHKSRLVVNGEVAQNELFMIRVSRSVGIDEPIPQNSTEAFNVINARVLLKQNGVIVDSLNYNNTNKRYEGTKVRAMIGNTYTVVATAPAFGEAEATSYLPSLIRQTHLAIGRKVRTNEHGQPLDEVTITFKDDVSTKDHYLIRIKGAYGQYVFCARTNDKDIERPVSTDPFSTDDCLGGNELLFSDNNFNGTTKTIVFNIFSTELNEYTDRQGNTLRPTIELLHVTSDYFKNFKSLHTYNNTSDNPFAEPVNVFTNIKNGYGFFTTYAMAVDTLR